MIQMHETTYHLKPSQRHRIRVTMDFKTSKPSAKQIIKAASEIFCIHENVILSDRRDRRVVRARWAVAYVMWKLTDMSFPQMGLALKRDHSTICHAVTMAQRILAEEYEATYDGPDFRHAVDEIIKAVRIT